MLGGVLKAGGRIEGCTLTGEDWTEAELPDTTFVGCTIEDVAFASTVLEGARFERCRLIRCRFQHADLREATFEDCQFADRSVEAGPRFAFSRLEGARLARCDLTHARFEGCELYDVRFQACNLTGAAFSRVSFARAFGRKVERIAAELTDCNLELADLAGARLPGASLARSRLREADLSGADLEGADLTGADLFQAIVDERQAGGRGPARRRGERARPQTPRHLPGPEDHCGPAVPPARRHGHRRPAGVSSRPLICHPGEPRSGLVRDLLPHAGAK